MKNEKSKEYSNGEVTIVWKPDLCIHSRNCVRGLPGVFDAAKRPWIDPKGAATRQIIEQVKQCPSGALSYFLNEEAEAAPAEAVAAGQIVEVRPDGPLLVHGDILLKDGQGNEVRKQRLTAFCRCGASENKPFCDGSHRKISFRG